MHLSSPAARRCQAPRATLAVGAQHTGRAHQARRQHAHIVPAPSGRVMRTMRGGGPRQALRRRRHCSAMSYFRSVRLVDFASASSLLVIAPRVACFVTRPHQHVTSLAASAPAAIPSNATTRRNAGLHSARGRIFPRLTSDGQFARDDRTRPHLLIPIQIPPRDAKWLSHSPGRARVPRARAALLGALLCDCRRHKQFNPPSCIALASPRASPQTSSTTAGKTRPFVFPRYLRTVRQSALPYGIDSREQGLIWKMAMARLPGVHKRPCGTGGAEAH